jgi:hypothetical protein
MEEIPTLSLSKSLVKNEVMLLYACIGWLWSADQFT